MNDIKYNCTIQAEHLSKTLHDSSKEMIEYLTNQLELAYVQGQRDLLKNQMDKLKG